MEAKSTVPSLLRIDQEGLSIPLSEPGTQVKASKY